MSFLCTVVNGNVNQRLGTSLSRNRNKVWPATQQWEQHSTQPSKTPSLSAVSTPVRSHAQPNRYVSCEMLAFSYWCSWQIWRDWAGPWPSTQAVSASHRLNEVCTELLCVWVGMGIITLIYHTTPSSPPRTVADLLTNNRSWPGRQAQFLYNKELLFMWTFSAYLEDSCWQNNLGSNITDQDEKPLDMESESHFRTSACFLTTGWNSRVVLSMQNIPEIKRSEENYRTKSPCSGRKRQSSKSKDALCKPKFKKDKLQGRALMF